MTRGWRRKAGLALVAAILQVPVSGIQFSFCSNVNTGSDYTPDLYSANSLGHCRDDVCKNAGYAFSITQYTRCWCSNFAPEVKTPNSACSRPCPGFPYEMCGSDDGDFSYLQIGTPSGTVGSSPSPTEEPSSSEVTQSIVYSTVISSNVVIRTTVRTQVVTERPSATSTPSVSIQVVTVGGNIMTSFVTLVPSQPAGASPDIRETHNEGLSNGAVAGITIGVVAAVAIAAGFVYFCCFRRRRHHDDDDENGEGKLGRNTSVLSKAGLLRHTSTRAGPPVSTISNRPPRLDTNIPGASAGPSSAATSGGMLERRDSRPLFRDQRLNPHAIMLHPDHSRASLSTLQDNQDYSRPLEVRNPDPLAR